jgi:N-ethylmaleimide reductase
MPAGRDRPNISFDIHKFFRALYKGPLMINGGLTIEEGNAYVADGTADAVQYGIHFIANPNLPELVAKGVKTQALTAGGLDMGLWFSADESKDAVGYTDYPPNAAEASA